MCKVFRAMKSHFSTLIARSSFTHILIKRVNVSKLSKNKFSLSFVNFRTSITYVGTYLGRENNFLPGNRYFSLHFASK